MSSSTSQTTVTCPKCKSVIPVDEAIFPQVAEAKEKYRQEMMQWRQSQEEKIQKEAQELKEKLKKELASQNDQEIKLLKEQNEEQSKKLSQMQGLELQLRKEKNALDEEKKAFELKIQRQLDEEREKIKENTAKTILEEHQLKDAEKEKKIADMSKMIEELKLKASQGSQQLQGEVLELELEEMLRRTFPLDEIIPVAKGINGADVIQKIHDLGGRSCGSIVWESKRTKNWTEGWVQKLKDDLRAAKGDVAVLVSGALPPDVNKFGSKDGIYVTNFESFLSVASLLRIALIEQNKTRLSVVGKNEKMEAIYNYLSGNEFRQKVEAIVEAFSSMQADLEKEKRMYAQIWAKREKQIQRVLDNTIGMHGDLQGLMGASLPQIASLELEIEEEISEAEVLEEVSQG